MASSVSQVPPRTSSPIDGILTALLTSEHPSLTSAPTLLHSMNAQPSFQKGEPSPNALMLLERLQFTDPNSPDIDEDNTGLSWGHYQFTAGGLNLLSSLITWKDVGSVAIAFKFVAAALKICQEARLICEEAKTSTVGGFISDVFLEKTLVALEKCWVGAGGVSLTFSCSFSLMYCTPFFFLDDYLSRCPAPSFHTFRSSFRRRKVTPAPS